MLTLQPKFIEIETVYDDQITSAFVNPDQVRYVRPAAFDRIDQGQRTIVSFVGGGYVMSRKSPGEIVAILAGTPEAYGEA